jgi:hypothetical protein
MDYMGDGGLRKRTLLQLLHSLFDLQKCFPGTKFGESWKIVNDLDDKQEHENDAGVKAQDNSDNTTSTTNSSTGTTKHAPNKIVTAVLTCWQFVTMVNDHLLENWDTASAGFC